MNKGLKLKIELDTVDKILEALCAALLILLWLGTTLFFSKLPDQIPSHFNALGEADDYSTKQNIFVLPIVTTVIYIGMTLLNRHPHLYNYPAVVTEANAKRLYTYATKLIRVLKLVVILIFSAIVFMTYRIVLTDGEGLGKWFLALAVGLLMLPTVFYLLKSMKVKQAR